MRRVAVTVGMGLAASVGAVERVDLGFREGLAPLDVGGDAPSAEACGECHEDELRAWAGSRHRVAHTNAIYQAGLIAEPSAFCVNCHSPLPEQAAEVVANLRWYRAQDVRRGGVAGVRAPEPRAAEGVGCAACHWRDGAVLADEDVPWGPHPTVRSVALTDGTLCRGCHEFRMPAIGGGELRLTDVPMQSTWSEWRGWADAGGDETCVSCHMPGGEHVFHGAHDRDLLAGSVAVEAVRDGAIARFTLESVGVGHHLPSGDLFRALTLEIERGRGWEIVHRVGRTFAVTMDPHTGHIRKDLAADTSLRPGERREVEIEAPEPLRWRLRFHYGAPHDEERGLVPLEELIALLAEGDVL